jgi:hypothetical protein
VLTIAGEDSRSVVPAAGIETVRRTFLDTDRLDPIGFRTNRTTIYPASEHRSADVAAHAILR